MYPSGAGFCQATASPKQRAPRTCEANKSAARAWDAGTLGALRKSQSSRCNGQALDRRAYECLLKYRKNIRADMIAYLFPIFLLLIGYFSAISGPKLGFKYVKNRF